ncbi:MAG: hypothetical protein KGZ43_02540, partial [Sulfuritalea sp.]|nr:hypothetical protein [Sulfuritalea sp.]
EELAGAFDLEIGHWRTLFGGRSAAPDLIVAVGVAALDGVLESLGRRDDSWARVPLLATMTPQAVFQARRAAPVIGPRQFSAALIDQPFARQLALIRLALPQHRRVGVLAGPQTRPFLGALEKEGLARGLGLYASRPVGAADEIYPALRGALDESDVILALPDPLIYNSASLQNILLATYRARTPLVAFSPAYVRAGATLALYSTPAQLARGAAAMVRQWHAGRSLPPAQKPREFEVAVNARVAASLNLSIEPPAALAAELRRLEGRP